MSKSKPTSTANKNQQKLVVQFNDELKAKLLAMEKLSHQARQKIRPYKNKNTPQNIKNEVKAIDLKNSQELAKIVELNGWPNPSLVGVKANEAAFLIAQQADLSLQLKLLPLLKSEFELGLLSGHKLALFTDRVLIQSGKKQRYGTQLAIVNGDIVFNEIEDQENIDQRREQMGMMSMLEYRKLLTKMYKLKSP